VPSKLASRIVIDRGGDRMLVRAWYLATLVLTTLLMGTSFAHTLEMPAKLVVDGPVWMLFQHTLYPFFAYVGAPVELGSIFTAAGLAFLLRGQRQAFYMTAVAALCFAAAFGVWLGFTNPVNVETGQWTANSLPSDWTAWRAQWEYSHAARFALHFCGFVLLALPLVVSLPVGSRRSA
jgi:hypothetical protein